jgi:hypothetical protein
MWEEEGAELSQCDKGVTMMCVVFGFAFPLHIAEAAGVGDEVSVGFRNDNQASLLLFRR